MVQFFENYIQVGVKVIKGRFSKQKHLLEDYVFFILFFQKKKLELFNLPIPIYHKALIS